MRVTDEQHDEWWERTEDAPLPTTHVITWQPTFRIAMKIAPFEDPAEVLAYYVAGWNDIGGEEFWTEQPHRMAGRPYPSPAAMLGDVVSEGSVQRIEEAEAGSAREETT